MPGLPTRAGSSALPERPKAERDLGAQRLHAHICTYESVRDVRGVLCERIDTDTNGVGSSAREHVRGAGRGFRYRFGPDYDGIQ